MPGVLRTRRLGLARLSLNSLHPDTASYRDRILNNGGQLSDDPLATNAISNNELNAINTFVKSGYTDGWKEYVLDSCIPIGTGLLTAQVKLWYPSGVSAKVTLINVVAGDYSRTTGFTFGGIKYANTGLNPVAAGLDSNNVHLSIYNQTNNAIAAVDIGSQTSVNNRLTLAIKWSDNNSYWDSYNISTGRTSGTNTTSTGLCLANRISTTDSKIYQRGTQIGASIIGGSSPGSQNIYWGALNDNGATTSHAARSHGGYSIGLGIPTALVLAYSTAWQTLMTALGRAA